MRPKTPKAKRTENPFFTLFKQIDTLVAETATRDEILQVLQTLVTAIKDVDGRLSNTITTTSSELDQKAQASLESLRSELMALEQRITNAVSNAESKGGMSLETAIQNLRAEIQDIKDSIPELPDYTQTFKEIESKIPVLPPEKLGEDFRNALEALNGEDRLAMEAIRGLTEELTSIKNRPVASGVTDKQVQFALMRSIQAVTPSGTIDGVNATFTVPSTIHAVLSFELNSRVVALGEYSITGSARKTIVFDTAPSANYSGKSFVITYI